MDIRVQIVLAILLAAPAIALAQEPFTVTVNEVSFRMVYVQGGTFTMGATAEQGSDAEEDEYPAHKVTLSDYYLGETEVTQQLWEAVMGNNPSYYIKKDGDVTVSLNKPVEQVSWEDCQIFISKLNELTGKQFRLPTEAEWEFAARGGTRSKGRKYSGGNNLTSVAWCWENTGNHRKESSSRYGTHAVKTKKPNELGLYDMSGNVWEWCQDWYDHYSEDEQANPQGASSGAQRIGRGGGWSGDEWDCRVSYRGVSEPSTRSYYIGLRLAL